MAENLDGSKRYGVLRLPLDRGWMDGIAGPGPPVSSPLPAMACSAWYQP
jgi:hypothetical protein